MQVNSPESLETGRRLFKEHGSWSAVQEASWVTPDGVYVLKEDPAKLEDALKRLEKVGKPAR